MHKACQVQRIRCCHSRYVSRANHHHRSAQPPHLHFKVMEITQVEIAPLVAPQIQIQFKTRPRARHHIILPLHTLPLPRSVPLAHLCHIVTLLTATEILCKYQCSLHCTLLFSPKMKLFFITVNLWITSKTPMAKN